MVNQANAAMDELLQLFADPATVADPRVVHDSGVWTSAVQVMAARVRELERTVARLESIVGEPH